MLNGNAGRFNKPFLFLNFLFITALVYTGCSSSRETMLKIDNWRKSDSLPSRQDGGDQPGLAGPVTGIHEGVLFVAGGANFPMEMPWKGGRKKYYRQGYLFRKNGLGHWQYFDLFHLPNLLAYSANCSAARGIVFAGGENENGLSKGVFLLAWENEAAVIRPLPDLPVAVTNAAMTQHAEIVYVAGGETAAGVSNQFIFLDLNEESKGWQQLPSLPCPVSHCVLVHNDDDANSAIFLIGGRMKAAGGISTIYSSVYKYNVHKTAWVEKAPLPYPLSAGTGIFANNHCYIFGGDTGGIFTKVEILAKAISAEESEEKKQQLISQKNELLSQHPGFSREIMVYNAATDKWTTAGNLPFECPVTTTAILFENQTILPSGEVKAGVRTPYIITGEFADKTKVAN